MDADEDWHNYDIQPESVYSPVDDHCEKVALFMTEHRTQLQDIEKAIASDIRRPGNHGAEPIFLHLQPHEKIELLDLVRTDNEQFDKIITVLAHVCDEIEQLKMRAQEELYPAIAVFGDTPDGKDEDDSFRLRGGRAEKFMGTSLQFFQRVSNFAERCNELVVNLIQQLGSVWQQNFRTNFINVPLTQVIKSISDVLGILITLDQVIKGNECIGKYWNHFFKMIDMIRTDREEYDVSDGQLNKMNKMLHHLKEVVFMGRMLEECIEQDFEDSEGVLNAVVPNIRNNKVFRTRFIACFNSLVQEKADLVGSNRELFERRDIVGLYGTLALLHKLKPASKGPNEKLFMTMWSLQKRIPCVTVYGKAIFFPGDFLSTYFNVNQFRSLNPKPQEMDRLRKEYLANQKANFAQTVRGLHMEVSKWMIETETLVRTEVPSNHQLSPDILRRQSRALHRGLVLANSVNTEVTTLINLHLALEVGMSKKLFRGILTCFEIVKGIEAFYKRKEPVYAETLSLIAKVYQNDVTQLIQPMMTTLQARRSDAKARPKIMDVLAACDLMVRLLQSCESLSPTRAVVIELCSNVITSEKLKQSDVQRLKFLLWQLNTQVDYQYKLRIACSTSYLYWHRAFLPFFFESIYAAPIHAPQLQYVINSYADGRMICQNKPHLPEDDESLENGYEDELYKSLLSAIVEPLCRDIDSNLRLRIHSVHLDHMRSPNPRENPRFNARRHFLALPPLRVFKRSVSLKRQVEHYLDRTFYNLTTVALHDWKTYGEMSNLAKEVYGLDLNENHLPIGTLDQGLDILQVMRNIDVFVERYLYNLNEQVFVERSPERGARHLNSINIHSISGSIRSHGPGIMNTTVNFVYQFLSQKFFIFSQFLADKYIKSHLSRERRWYKSHKETDEVDGQYPFERAVKFNKDIKKLGVSDDGLTFIDQFRLLITEIGNALGFVRMVRSAGLHYVSNAIKFVPDITRIINFEKYSGSGGPKDDVDRLREKRVVNPLDERLGGLDDEEEDQDETVEGASLSAETVEAAHNLDSVLGNLSSNFAAGTDFLKVLVAAFRSALSGPKNAHLKNFYMIVPSLVLNFAEKLRLAKTEILKMRGSHLKKNNRNAYFTDDGFAIGLSYILAILEQNDEFDSLQWFRSTNSNFASIAKDVNRLRSLNEQTEDTHQEIRFKTNRLADDRREIEMFYFCFSGSRIFFTEEEEDEEEEEEEEEAEGEAAGSPAAADASAAPPPPPPGF